MTRRIAIVATFALIGAGFVHATSLPAVPADPCRTVTLSENGTAADITPLLAAGWYGLQDDGAERLYSPACR